MWNYTNLTTLEDNQLYDRMIKNFCYRYEFPIYQLVYLSFRRNIQLAVTIGSPYAWERELCKSGLYDEAFSLTAHGVNDLKTNQYKPILEDYYKEEVKRIDYFSDYYDDSFIFHHYTVITYEKDKFNGYAEVEPKEMEQILARSAATEIRLLMGMGPRKMRTCILGTSLVLYYWENLFNHVEQKVGEYNDNAGKDIIKQVSNDIFIQAIKQIHGAAMTERSQIFVETDVLQNCGMILFVQDPSLLMQLQQCNYLY